MSTDQPNKRRLKNLVVNARYQISFALPLVLLSTALLLGLGYVATRKVETATTIGINQLDVSGAAFLEDTTRTREVLLHRETTLRRGIVVAGVVLWLSLVVFGLVLTHRVAGPLHRVGAELKTLSQGVFGPVQESRKEDLLVDFCRDFRLACEALRERERRDVTLWRRVLDAAALDSEVKNTEEFERLRARLRIKEEGLG